MDAPQVIPHEGGTAPREVPARQSEVRALAPQAVAASPLDLPSEQFRAGLERRRQNRAALMDWVRTALVEGVDYGRIPTKRGLSKPSLWKPGAEKICGMLGVTVHYPVLSDYEQAALTGAQLQHIIIRCEIHDAAGRVVADGVGARALKQDFGDLNKALKMAEKSAHIDATLRMAGLSEIFTQDLEDMIPPRSDSPAGKPAVTSSPPAQAGDPNGSGPVPPGKNGTFISAARCRQLDARIAELGLDRERVRAWVQNASRGQVRGLDQLTPAMYLDLNDRLEEWAQHTTIQEQNP